MMHSLFLALAIWACPGTVAVVGYLKCFNFLLPHNRYYTMSKFEQLNPFRFVYSTPLVTMLLDSQPTVYSTCKQSEFQLNFFISTLQ